MRLYFCIVILLTLLGSFDISIDMIWINKENRRYFVYLNLRPFVFYNAEFWV